MSELPLQFTKMHGLGNDYIYMDVFTQRVEDPPALSRAISDRHRGVGSDGLILVGPPEARGAHVRMRMFNADGSESEMCGNGIRCVGKFAYERGLARVNPLRVETGRGVLELMLELDSASARVQRVRVDMGDPILAPSQIPVSLEGDRVIDVPLAIEGANLRMTCVSMGNPHAVFFVDDLAAVPLADWGPRLERHPLFPQRVNAHFVQIKDRGRVDMITWERGSGATQACGTGACAVCVASVLNKLTERKIIARLPGGELELHWDSTSGHVFMTGPAEEICDGQWLKEAS